MFTRFTTAAALGLVMLAACVQTTTVPLDASVQFQGGNERLQSCIETQCKTLTLDGYFLEDFSVLNDLPHIEVLMLSRTNIADLSMIAGMTQLKELHIAWTDIADLSALPGFTNLELLHVSNMENVRNWAPARNMTGLRELAIDIPAGDGFAFTQNMRGLETLYVGDGEVTDMSGLAGHPRLRHVTINAAINADPTPLLDMPALRRITFDWFELNGALTKQLEDKGVEIDQIPVIVC